MNPTQLPQPAQPSFDSFVKGLGVSSSAPQQPKPQMWGDKLQSLYDTHTKSSQPTEDPNMIKVGDTNVVGGAMGGALKTIGSAAKSGFDQATDAVSNILGTGDNPSTTPVQGLEEGLKAGSGIASVALSPLAPLFAPITKALGGEPSKGSIMDRLMNDPSFQKFAMSNAGEVTSRIAGDAANAGNIAGGILGAEGVAKGIPKIPQTISDVKQGVSDLVTAGKEKVFGTPEEQAAKQVQSSIDAVNPDLSGKKLTGAYKQVVTGNREVTPASIFREQGLSPDQQSVNLGTRLKDLNLGKDPVKNLDNLANGLTDTETKLQTALKGDPEINYNADKPTLFSKLNEVSSNAPQEFRIKEPQTMIDSVVKFAQKVIGKSEDSITGVRDGRTAFDTQAKVEYPNAFKPDGSIDVKTPAGYAIKKVRDTINEHLYNTAPNGSEIQTLIGREADIFRASESIAPKAASGEGKNGLIQWIKNNPNKARAMGIGASLLGGGFIAHEVGF